MALLCVLPAVCVGLTSSSSINECWVHRRHSPWLGRAKRHRIASPSRSLTDRWKWWGQFTRALNPLHNEKQKQRDNQQIKSQRQIQHDCWAAGCRAVLYLDCTVLQTDHLKRFSLFLTCLTWCNIYFISVPTSVEGGDQQLEGGWVCHYLPEHLVLHS